MVMSQLGEQFPHRSDPVCQRTYTCNFCSTGRCVNFSDRSHRRLKLSSQRGLEVVDVLRLVHPHLKNGGQLLNRVNCDWLAARGGVFLASHPGLILGIYFNVA